MTNIPFDIFTDTLEGLVCERVLDEEIRSFIEDGYFESFGGLRLDLPDNLIVIFSEPISIFEQELLEEIVANHDGYDCPEPLPEDAPETFSVTSGRPPVDGYVPGSISVDKETSETFIFDGTNWNLINSEPEESLFEEYEFTNFYRVKKITVWNNSSKERKLKEYVMEYDGAKTISVIEISFKKNGKENKRTVTQYNYNNFNIDNIVRFSE